MTIINLKKSHKIAIFIFLLSFLWIISGIIFKTEGALEAETLSDDFIYRVKVANLTAEKVNAELVLKGKTKAFRRVMIKAETSGTIARIIKDEGEKVKTHDVLLTISQDDRLIKLEEAKALVEQRQLEWTASKNLSQKGFNSQIRFAEAETALNSAKAKQKSAELDLKRTNITAPFNGYLDKRLVEVGDFVTIGTPIAEIVDLNPIKITAEISEINITSIIEGLPAEATLIDGTKLEGKITFVSKIANETTRTYTMEMIASNLDSMIAEGMTVEVRLLLSPVKAYLVSPAILSLNDKGEIGVKTVDEHNLVQFHKINIVKHDDHGMWITGLPNQIRLITAGGDFVKEQTKVIAVDESN